MNPRIRHMQPTQPFIQVLGKTAWAAQVEIVVVQRQRRLDLLDTQPTGKLVITPRQRMLFRLAQGAVHVQQAAGLLPQTCQLLTERQVGQAARTMEQMNAPCLPLLNCSRSMASNGVIPTPAPISTSGRVLCWSSVKLPIGERTFSTSPATTCSCRCREADPGL